MEGFKEEDTNYLSDYNQGYEKGLFGLLVYDPDKSVVSYALGSRVKARDNGVSMGDWYEMDIRSLKLWPLGGLGKIEENLRNENGAIVNLRMQAYNNLTSHMHNEKIGKLELLYSENLSIGYGLKDEKFR